MKNRYSYDAWDRPRSPSTWALMPFGITSALVNNLSGTQPRFDRGYTGHEQMAGFGLINMNGRLYDPYLQRFLSPDRYVQQPENAQSYNRYSYCLNSPLMYTDPSGWQFYAADYYISPDYYNYMEGASSGRKGNGSGSYGPAAGSLGYTCLNDGSYMDRATGDIVAWETVYNNYVVPNSASPKSINNDPILSKYFFCVGKATIKANGDVMQNDNGNKYAFQLFINDSPIAKFILIDINTAQGGGGSGWINDANNVNTGFGVGSGVMGGNYGLTANQTFRYAQRINGRVVSAAELTAAHAAQSMKVANALGRINVITGVLGTGYSATKVYTDYNKGGWNNVNGLDVADAGVGAGGLVVSGLVTLGLVSNPVGWCIGIGTGIYFGARLVYDLSKD